jgi:hypothetical protein
VVGGYAVGYHGYPRYTGDVDIFVAVSPQNGRALVKVFGEFGFPDESLTPEFFSDYGQVIRLGRAPMKLEIVNQIDGVKFSQCYAHRVRARIENLSVNFIAYADLLRNKRASGRHKALQDVEVLQANRTPKHRSR